MYFFFWLKRVAARDQVVREREEEEAKTGLKKKTGSHFCLLLIFYKMR